MHRTPETKTMRYNSVVGEAVAEKTIEKSRFLAYTAHVGSEEEAKAYLTRVRALHPMATHVCYGYIADKIGNLQRFSDDGEPQGTAGMPILGVLKAQELKETVVAVVRYFGGIKLGAGGLTRAYAGCAADGLEKSEIACYETGVEIELSVDYSEVNAALRFLEKEIVLSRDFSAEAKFTVIVKETDAEDFSARARDFLNGRVKLRTGNSYFYPF